MDSTTEGVSAEIARRHKPAGVDPRKVMKWVDEGMPVDSVDMAEEWVKRKRRGTYSKAASKAAAEESSALDDILKDATMASPGVLGVYARARAVEVKTYQAIMDAAEPTSTMLAARKGAQDALIAAKDAVAAYLTESQDLIARSDIMRAIQAQDGASMALGASMPHTLAPLLVNQPLEVIRDTLAGWWNETYLAKRREAMPFADGVEKSGADEVIDAAGEGDE